MTVRILPSGPRARLVEHDDPAGYAAGLHAAAADGAIHGLVDAIPAERTVLLRFDDTPPPDAILASIEPRTSLAGRTDIIEIPVVYDGEDLESIARTCGMGVEDVISLHSAPTYLVAFCGFAPGFAYLTGTDRRLHLPRRDTPRTRVPAGAVAIAAGYSAVYPLSSPGGWHLLGRTDEPIFDPTREEPALLHPGMRVRFIPSRSGAMPPVASSAPSREATDDPAFEVLHPGPLTLLQDLGRPGHGSIAVGESGAFDRGALRLANRIAGNPETAAGLEALGGGLTLRALRHGVVVVTGATGPLSVDGTPADRCAPLRLAPGHVVTLGQPVTGVRSIVAVRGGIEGPRVLGSLATDTLAGLGPQRIASGSLLSVGDARGDINVDHVPTSNPPSSITLRLHPGPRYEWLTASARTLLAEGVFTVGVDSDRIGVRLDGPRLDLREARPLASEGVVRGAVQVPPDGRPVVLGPDHPVTGGYPVVAVVEQVDALAQAAPGVPVRFTLVGW